MTLNKGTSKSRFFDILLESFVQNQVTAITVIIVLPYTCRKIAAVVLFSLSLCLFSFWGDPNDTSKIRDGDDANRQNQIFQTQTGKKKKKKF